MANSSKNRARTATVLAGLAVALTLAAQAQVQIASITRGADSVTLTWAGGRGPYLVETSPDLAAWSDLGEPAATTTRTLPAFANRSFYRVTDLDPAGQFGKSFGLIQTEQGESGALMARHRLKTRLWLYLTQGAPHTSTSYTPADYWRKLLVNCQHLEDGRVRTWTGPLEALGTVATPTSQRLTVSWTRSTGPDLRTYTLAVDFPYPVNTTRTTTPFPSDPYYRIECAYATPQPEFDWSAGALTTTRSDAIGLVQMDPGSDPTNPDQSWWVKRYDVSKNGVTLSLHFFEGLPLHRGEPPMIFKTLLLDRWISPTTGSGGSLPTFSTDSYFARTLLPGHHNFVETVLIEPGLDPAVSEATRAALLESNVRQIFAFKDLAIGMSPDDVRYFGFDNSVREP